MTGQALALLAECRRLGLDIRADGDRIKYRPLGRMTPDLADRIKENRSGVLAALRRVSSDSVTIDASRPPSSGKKTSGSLSAACTQLKGKIDVLSRVRWALDDLDRRVLLECGLLPTPDAADLSPAWRREYDRLAGLLGKRLGLYKERAEAEALRTVHRRMLAAGELIRKGW